MSQVSFLIVWCPWFPFDCFEKVSASVESNFLEVTSECFFWSSDISSGPKNSIMYVRATKKGSDTAVDRI